MTDHLKRVLLFGRTGAGKSTLGNMLYARKPSLPGGFNVGDGIRGVTSKVDIKSGRGWLVIDTIGMGEAVGGTVTTEDAENHLCEFLKHLKFTYSYLIYVVKRGRMEDAQSVTWDLFKKLFVGGETNFVVVFTGATETWLRNNMSDIRSAFRGCEHFCAVDLPPIEEYEEMDNLRSDRRHQSIQALEEKLANFGLQPVRPRISRMTDAELLQHVRTSLWELCTSLANRLSTAFDNPMQWILTNVLRNF